MSDLAQRLKPARVIHVVTSDANLGRVVERAVAGQSHVVRRQAKVPDVDANDLVLLDLPHGGDVSQLERVSAAAPTVVVSDRDPAAVAALLAAHPHLGNVVARTGPFFPRLLAATLGQVMDGDAWSFAGHLAPGTAVRTQALSGTVQKQACLDELEAFTTAAGAFSELPGLVATVASELLMNAFFNAPYDFENAKRKYKDKPRHEVLHLKKDEVVSMAFGRDEDMLAVQVRDRFGSLTRGALLLNLERAARVGSEQIRMKTQGAGVGLYLVLSSVTAVSVRVTPRAATEITALFALTKRYRDFEQLGRTVHVQFSSSGDAP